MVANGIIVTLDTAYVNDAPNGLKVKKVPKNYDKWPVNAVNTLISKNQATKKEHNVKRTS
jgi:hypothetical protein